MSKHKPYNLNLPIMYSTDASFDNDRFLKLRMKVCHTGLNLNGSHFGIDAINKAAPTISNIPLLAFIKKVDGEEGGDFGGHEYEIRITQDEMKLVYLGRPIGIIPETHNYDVKVDEEGKTFVEVDAYVWKDYANEALNILEEDQVKKVSMEIKVNDYAYNDAYVEILDYSYIGIALLGDDVNEAMLGAKAEVVNFSADSLTLMMEELKDVLHKMDSIEEDEVEEVVEDEEFEEELEENEEENEEEFEEELEEKVDEEIDEEEEFEESLEENGTKDSVAEFKKTILSLQEEIAELKKDKSKLEKILYDFQIAELIAKFSDLPEDQINELKEKLYPIEELELHLFALRGKLSTPLENKTKIVVPGTENYFSTVKKEPIYADLVRDHIDK